LPQESNQAAQVNGLTMLFQPPFVFFPLLVVLALVVGFGIWVRTLLKPREPDPEASVSHHRVRGVEYTPPAEVELPPAPGYFAPRPPVEEQQPQPQPPPASAPPPPKPQPRPLGSDEPPDLPEPGE
jgi:hypothetical protein